MKLTYLPFRFIVLSPFVLALSCFEEIDAPSPCYNLTELNMPSTLPEIYQGTSVSLVEYKFSYLRDQSLHCEIESGSSFGNDACLDFYEEKLGLANLNNQELYSSFPGIDCVQFFELKDKDYGYCETLKPNNSECQCLFHRDCQISERCYAGRLYDINCESASCSRCLPKDDPPPLK
jgi:hypothetical protein